MKRLFTTSEAADVTGATPRLINDWEAARYVVPAEKLGAGSGLGMRWDLSQVVAIRLMVNLKKLGVRGKLLGDAYSCLGSMGEERMRLAIESGVRAYMPGAGFYQPAGGADVPELLDLAAIYRDVERAFRVKFGEEPTYEPKRKQGKKGNKATA